LDLGIGAERGDRCLFRGVELALALASASASASDLVFSGGRERSERKRKERKKKVDMWVAIYCLWSIEVSKKVRIATLLEEEKEKKKKIAKFNLLVKVALLLEMP
jgi:hypothetical protein